MESTQAVILVQAGARTVTRITRATVSVGGRISAARLTAMLASRLSTPISLTTDRMRIDYALDRNLVAHLVTPGPNHSAAVRLKPVAARISAPAVAQKLHNDCEAAALQTLLATDGIASDQLTLQAQLPRSGPLDPKGSPPDQVWGDPSQGFVGRADGSGPAGGFGVYQGPVAQLANRYGRRLRDLTGSAPRLLYRRLLAGHAIMVWVGLADGPYGRWRSPSGQPVVVNFNEHTAVLTGIGADGTLDVINPLTGTREQWTRAQFETMWSRLGRRALST